MRFGKSSGGGRRIAPREVAPVLAIYFTLTETGRASVVDVSRTGARLRGDTLPGVGEELIVSIDGIRTYGTAIWAKGNECGIAFGEPLSPASLDSIRADVARARGTAPEAWAAFEDWSSGLAR